VVIYEPASQRRLGSANIEPTASVKVVLKPNATMDRKLVVAIADLITGSVSGMNRSSVRIIDNSGQSYHVGAEGSDAPEDRLEQLRLAEAYHREKIQSALRYIQNVVVGVCVEGDGASGVGGVGGVGGKCLGASVSVPRSYLAGIAKAGLPATTGPTQQASGSPADQQLARIQQVVMGVIGTGDPASVKVDWYIDSPSDTPAAASAAANELPQSSAGWLGRYWHIFAATIVVFAIACIGGVFWSRHRRVSRDAADESADIASLADGTALARPAFAFLQGVSLQDLLASLRQEHPQTIALVLAHLPPEKSAAVLDGMEATRQIEVMRRIAAMETIDPEVVAEVEASVAEKLGAIAPDSGQTPGLDKVTQILHHAVARTEQSVMQGLRDQEPDLAESISQKMFRFEDIMHIPTVRLRPVLERCDAEELAIALRTANQQMHKRVLGCLSSAAAGSLREEIERLGPVKLSDVETAQQHIAEAVRRLSDGQYVSQQSTVDSELLA
jgi:flagellar motor switch protein FliG